MTATILANICRVMPEAPSLPRTIRSAQRLRDMIYDNTAAVGIDNPYGSSQGLTVNWLDIEDMFHRAINTEEGFACGGTALLFLAALQALGWEARFVGIVEKAVDSVLTGPDASKTHASAEVKLGGKWYSMDPHYNVSLYHPTTRACLSWAEAFALQKAGTSPALWNNGLGQDEFLNKAHLQTYYSPAEIMNWMILGPSRSEPNVQPLDGWDGVIHYANNGRPPFDFTASLDSLTYRNLI